MSNNPLFGSNSPLPQIPQSFPTEIDSDLFLGLDLGIGSCGQALVRAKESSGEKNRIIFTGSRVFDIPEDRTQSGVKLRNPDRRAARLSRRTIRRHAHRMERLRNLLKREGVLPSDYHISSKKWQDWHSRMTSGDNGELGQSGPWVWRAEGLDRKLAPLEWAALLLHLTKHRGFKSNKKSELALERKVIEATTKELKKDNKTGKEDSIGTLKGTAANHDRLSDHDYRTVGEMAAKDGFFSEQKRNRSGEYLRSILRDDLTDEKTLLFSRQRSLGNRHASETIEAAFTKIFLGQRPLQNPIKLLGHCSFEPEEKRGAILAYSAELSRALQKINTLTLVHQDSEEEALQRYISDSDNKYSNFVSSFGNQAKISWNDLRKHFGIPETTQFKDVASDKKTQTADFATASSKRSAAHGSNILSNVLGDEVWSCLTNEDPRSLDELAFALTFFEVIGDAGTKDSMLGYLHWKRINPVALGIITAALENREEGILKFSGKTNLSHVAHRNINTHLQDGLVYSVACEAAGYDHTKRDFNFDTIVNPIVKSVVRETCKQVVHLICKNGKLPGKIVVEIGRDLGKSIPERKEITLGITKRTKNKNANRLNFATALERPESEVSNEDHLRYELYKCQSALCPYCGEYLGRENELLNTHFQIDHILPRSRSHDNSFHNKVLVHTHCNQNKGSQTPSEWFGLGTEQWQKFSAWVSTGTMPSLRKQTRRNLLNTTFSDPERESRFRESHLNDTRYISKLITAYLNGLYIALGESPGSKGSTRRVFVQPGPLTALVRRSWGLEDLKKDLSGQRIGDKHHAVDALVCALTSEGQRQFITSLEKTYKEMEKRGRTGFAPKDLPLPWSTLRKDVVNSIDAMTVSRKVKHITSGALHDETNYGLSDKGYPFLRRSLIKEEKGKRVGVLQDLGDLARVKDVELPCNSWLKASLTDWINRGSPVEELPKDNQGNTFSKVKMFTNLTKAGIPSKKTLREQPQGLIAGGTLSRIDIFSKPDKRGNLNYSIVPIYVHDLNKPEPPMRAIVAAKEESEWTLVTHEFEFCFSLSKNMAFSFEKKGSAKKPVGDKGTLLFNGVNRNNAKIDGIDPNDSQKITGVSIKTGCLSFHALIIDRLGNVRPKPYQPRQWRGAASI